MLRSLATYFALFILSGAAYVLLSWLDSSWFLSQAVMVPALIVLKTVAWAFSLQVSTGWTDVDSTAQYAMLGRAIAFASTVVVVWHPIAAYRRKPTRWRKVAAIAVCLFVCAALVMYVVLYIGVDQAWRD